MRKPFLNLAPIGRLHEPLHELAARLHRAMGTRPRSMWADASGGVFLDDLLALASMPPRALVGTYDKDTPVLTIEVNLRLALRERAKQWITDWDTYRLDVANGRAGASPMHSPRGRPLRLRIAIKGIPLRRHAQQTLVGAEIPAVS